MIFTHIHQGMFEHDLERAGESNKYKAMSLSPLSLSLGSMSSKLPAAPCRGKSRNHAIPKWMMARMIVEGGGIEQQLLANQLAENQINSVRN